MKNLKVTSTVENDIEIPNSTKYSTDKENEFVYNVDGVTDAKAQQAMKNSIQAHAKKNKFTAEVTFNTAF